MPPTHFLSPRFFCNSTPSQWTNLSQVLSKSPAITDFLSVHFCQQCNQLIFLPQVLWASLSLLELSGEAPAQPGGKSTGYVLAIPSFGNNQFSSKNQFCLLLRLPAKLMFAPLPHTWYCQLVSPASQVTSVALVSAYSLAWHCVNVIARAVVRMFLFLLFISVLHFFIDCNYVPAFSRR